ncbi:sensor histidine kinase [Albibacterium profundi]|uniref:histidine kinase n=1 Tax=Albibacterium profundi TaxID=3134906 RepID=A0ABV5CEG8_9SPHI
MRKPLFIFYFLFFYAIMQLIWWGVLLAQIAPERKAMFIGEGLFFFVIFIGGAIKLKQALKREKKLHQQQHNFMLSVTHELKSPLASIKLYIQTILKRELDREQQQQFLKNSLKDIERLDDLVENVLIATKLESQKVQFQKERFNFSNVVTRISERLQVYSCTTQSIKLNVEPDIYINGDHFALSSMITNLLENAIKYSPPCEQVAVKLYEDKGSIVLSVADFGIGVDDEEKKRIFSKFYRVGSEETRKTKGTGLGLYIVKTVVDRHYGQIKVKDNKPSGTIFEITFNQ